MGAGDKATYTLENICRPGCPCKDKEHYTHLNLKRKLMEKDPFGGRYPPAELPETKQINVRGRHEHEAIIKDAAWCKELGLDQTYEIMVYMKRWGEWLRE